MTVKTLLRRMPLCIAGSVDQEETPADFAFLALHALDMYDEGQDGCDIQNARQRAAVVRFRAFCLAANREAIR